MKIVAAIPDRFSPDSAGFAQLARIHGLVAAKCGSLHDIAKQFGSERVQRVVKAEVGAIDTDHSALVDRNIVVGAFVDLMRHDSIFYALLAAGMVKLPMRTFVEMATLAATAWIVNEGKPIPVTGVGFSRVRLDPVKAAAIAVITKELLMAGEAEALVSRALRTAIGTTVDMEFLNLVIDGSTPVNNSSGTDAEAAAVDLRMLLDDVAPTTSSRLVLAMDPQVQRAASMLTTLGGEFVFPDLTPTAGTIKGMPVLPSSAIGSGKVALFDGSGIAGASEDIEIEAGSHATVEMLDANLQQDSAAPESAVMTSMFQTNCVALRGVASFATERLRTNAVAVLQNVNWGGAAPAS